MRETIVLKNLDYLILFILIFTSRETVLFGTNQDSKLLMIGYLSPLLVLLLLILRKNKYCNANYDNYYSLNLFYMLSICSVVTMVCNFDVNIKYGYEILLYLLSYHIVNQIDFNRFVKIYCDIINFIAIFAVITAIVYFVTPSLMDFFPIINNKGNLQYYNLFFSVIQVENYSGENFRLYGIFREPGVAIIFFNLALILELFVRDGKKILRVLTLLLAIGLSFSTAGYIVCSLIFLLYLLYNKQVNKGVFFFSIVFVGAIVFLIFSNDFIYMMVFYKFENSESTSTAARFGSVSTNLNLLIKSPIGLIWGLGYQYVENAFEILGKTVDEGLGHNTNTILKELSVHGAFFTTLLIVNIYQFVKNRILYNGLFSFILFAIVILALGNEDLTADLLLFLLVFYSQISENLCLEAKK